MSLVWQDRLLCLSFPGIMKQSPLEPRHLADSFCFYVDYDDISEVLCFIYFHPTLLQIIIQDDYETSHNTI